MSLIHLHGHSTFSFLDGYGTPKQIAQRIKELGHTACAITDHGNVFAHVPYQKAMRAEGITPIFGCEFYVVDNMRERTREQESIGANAYPHVTVLAYNDQGYRHLLKLSRLSYEEGFYYKPRIDWQELAKYQDGLVVLSGCVGGYPSRLILSKGVEEAHVFISRRRQQIEHYYVELIPEPGLGESHNTMWRLAQIAADLSVPCVMTADAHFPRPEDHEVQDLMLCVGIRKKLSDSDRGLKLPAYQYYCSEQELWQRALECSPTQTTDMQWLQNHYWQAIQNTSTIASMCQVELPRGSGVVFPGLPAGKTAEQQLWEQAWQGLSDRFRAGQIGALDWNRYYAQLEHEYQVIVRKGFSDYLLAIADVVNWMKKHGALIICRGSAGGSLLLWALAASETDPIRHGLSFERFYDDNRPDPPDVDIDFESARRDEAIQYVFGKYGTDRCSKIATLAKVGAKGALQDAASAYGIARNEFAPLSAALDSKDADVEKQLHEVTDPAALAVLQRHPELRIIDRMVGQYRQSSIHAAGVLVSPEPLDKLIGVVLGQDREPVAAVDKYGAAELGFLKMDFLSVDALDVIANTIRRLGKTMDWLFTLPLDDQPSLETAERGMLAGIFQLDGAAAHRVAKEIGIDTFDDVVAASALCRPGPADWVQIYKTHKREPQKFQAYLSQYLPQIQDIIRPTFGILLYQEQVMRLAREVAGFDWPDVHKLRKGVVDKVGLDPQKGPPWRAEWGQKFVSGCLNNGLTIEEANRWWAAIQTHGGYSFNKAHCVTYGLVGYWMLYLKTHYPGEFYESYLSREDDPLLMKRLIREFKSLGNTVVLLDPRYSKQSFSSPRPGVLCGGYINLTGVGPKGAQSLVQAGPYESWDDFFLTCPKALKLRLDQTGIFHGDVNVQSIIQLAPWLPPIALGKEELSYKQQWGLIGPSELPINQQMDGDATVSGYVTATKFDKDRLIFILEDSEEAITCRVPLKQVKIVGPKFRELTLADYVAVVGWWTGDTLFVKDVTVLKKAYGKAETTKTKVKT